MRVLVVEDEPRMGELIRRVLLAERYAVDLAEDGVGALALAREGGYDAIVLDRMLPDLDGTEVLQVLRTRGDHTPVLMLTALGSVEQRVAGLDAGADDYLSKPFAFSELLARLRALGRRPVPGVQERLVAGDVELDEQRHVVRVAGATVELTAREFALLAFLIRNAGHVLSRRQILDAVWGAEPDVYSNVVDLYISYLRRKLATLGREGRLRTVRGVGYTLDGTD